MTPSGILKRAWKFLIGIISAGLILLAVLQFWVTPSLEGYLNRQDLGAVFKKATGGTFTSGKLILKLWPYPHVVVPEGRIEIPTRLFVNWRNLRVYPAFLALLKGQLQIGRIVLKAPALTIAALPSTGMETSASAPPMPLLSIQQELRHRLDQAAALLPDAAIEIRGGRISTGAIDSVSINIKGFDLNLQLPPHTLRIDLRCQSNLWQDFRLSGNLDPGSLEGQLQTELVKFNPTPLAKVLNLPMWQWNSSPLDMTSTVTLKGLNVVTGTVLVRIPDLQLQRGPNKVPVTNVRMKAALDVTPTEIRIAVEELLADQPSLNVSGQGIINPKTPLYQIELKGQALRIDSLRETAMALAGDDETVAGIFKVLQGGDISWIRFRTQGASAAEMGVFRNMTISGRVDNGRLFIPGAGLNLTDVQGTADISGGILEGRHLRAAYGKTIGSDGRLWLDFDQQDEVPFFLEIGVDAHLKRLPSLLAKWVKDPDFKGEMRRIQALTGRAEGMLVLDGRGPKLDVTVDVTRCRLEAAYDRLPSPVNVAEGMVQYTEDRIQVIEMRGSLGTSRFSGLTGHVAFGKTNLIVVDEAAVSIDIHQIAPWLERYGVFESLPYTLASKDGRLELAHLKIKGPLVNPAQWAFDTQGTVNRLNVISSDLPGPTEIKSARFKASTEKLEVSKALVSMADADLVFQKTHIDMVDYEPVAGECTFSGRLGPVSENWISNRIALEASWQLKSPLAVSGTTISWSANGAYNFRGEVTTAGGVRVRLGLKRDHGNLRHQTLAVDDQDSQAELQATFGPESFEIDYHGHINSATIGRMIEEDHFPSGRMKGQLKARIFPNQPGRSSVSGELYAHDIRQPIKIKRKLNIKELSLKAEGNKILLAPAIFDVDDQTHQLTGSIAMADDGYILDLVHTATVFSLKPPASDLPARKSDGISVWDLPLKGRVISRLDSFAFGKLRWSPFNATLSMDTGNWHFRIEDAALCGVETKGDIRVTRDTISLALQPEAREKDIDTTIACLLEKPDLIDGKFALTGRLETEGPPAMLSRNINGRMNLRAHDGRIYRFNLLSKALAVVNLTEIFRGKLPDLMEGGLAYESIDIEVEMQDSLLTVKEAVIDGASANIAGQGTIDLVTGETDMIVLVAPFKTVDAIVKFTPIINDWLGGTLVSIPVSVTGQFSDPDAVPLSPSAVGSSLMNLMKKTVNLPVKIISPLWETDAPEDQ